MSTYITGSDTSVTTEPCHMPCPNIIDMEAITLKQQATALSKIQELKDQLKQSQLDAETLNLSKAMKRKNYLARLSIKANQLPNRIMRNTNENL
ncbi:hypothetical protein [Aliivibrio logei]|uniref:Uncharacterized protein n=1 Tax=Aliivibrio logei 5S-186 TaxID=626086 RepID=A0ABX3AXA6_ALILO|nr:hypothetical protein [Aliivibrio logei]OEF17035.1 hypothetical protein A1Q5_19070 [Aliivibrio logei 5S-186]